MTSMKTGTGTLSMIGIIEIAQQQGTWFIFKFFPLGDIAFVNFVIAMIAKLIARRVIWPKPNRN